MAQGRGPRRPDLGEQVLDGREAKPPPEPVRPRGCLLRSVSESALPVTGLSDRSDPESGAATWRVSLVGAECLCEGRQGDPTGASVCGEDNRR